MIVSVKLFAAARQLAGSDTIDVELPVGATVGMLREALRQAAPELDSLLPHAMYAVDAQYASDTTKIPSDADVACIPPVSGG